MTSSQPRTIRCSACGTLNFFTTQLCENCKMPLADERNAFRAGQILPDPSPVSQVAPVIAVAQLPGNPEAEELLLPYQPLVIKPDPFFGPIFRRTVRYLLSHAAVEISYGLIVKQQRQVEMYRIGSREGDMHITRGPLQRLKRTGTLVIRSSDPDMPHMVLRDIHEPAQVEARIRYNAAVAQRERSPLNLGGDFHPVSDF